MLGGGFVLIVYICLFTSIVRARIIKVENLVQQFESQFQNDPLKALQQSSTQKVVIQQGFNNDKGLDANCLTWDSEPVVSGWTQDSKDSDFFVDYYVPPSSKAIICTTPIFAGALTADADKPFSYEVYRTEYGLRVRVIIGVSEVRELCQMLALDGNCLNSFLQQQAIVRYKH
ncbi:hypothetical protein DSM106972_053690 [Dulcicalothrix desertica PCC 7102]|uniref:Uncharacterized protein n=2 Tax=Dulcicalothrix desertica TaxID=32056 RepID=A0A3S1C9V2_9CYAN|nr:hypothetical protein DSM106972_053690 [Dulcicalothrix desertica PCC 7102]